MPIPVPIPAGTLTVTANENARVEQFVGYVAQLVKYGTSGYVVPPLSTPAAGPMLVPNGANPTSTVPVEIDEAKEQLWFRQTGFALLRALTPDIYGTDSSGTPGAAVINKLSGISAIANGASTVVITNNLVTTSSHILVTWHSDHGAARWWVARGAGSFTVTLSAASSGNNAFSWTVKTALF